MNSIQLVLAGFTSPPTFGLIASRIALWKRERNFRRIKTEQITPTYVPQDIPEATPTTHQQRVRDAYREIAATEHDRAKDLQARYVGCVAFASVAVLTAFLYFALETTLLADVEGWRLYAAASDVCALIVVVGGFLLGHTTRLKWLRARIVAEFVRQWGAVEGVFGINPGSFTKPLDDFISLIRKEVAAADTAAAAARALADSRLTNIAALLASCSSFTGLQLRRYVYARPIRQADWFARSIARLENHRSRRESVMVALFIAALLAASVKLVAELMNGPHLLTETSALAFLVASGIAAASTSAYLSKNDRSALHRYHAQNRLLNEWFVHHRDFIQTIRNDAALAPSQVQSAVEAVMNFERLMMNELVDWVAASEADGMELGPG